MVGFIISPSSDIIVDFILLASDKAIRPVHKGAITVETTETSAQSFA